MNEPETNMQIRDLSSEEWREYEFGGTCVRIEYPARLYLKDGSQFHRVVDIAGVTHCVPAPGQFGCVLRWKSNPPVSF